MKTYYFCAVVACLLLFNGQAHAQSIPTVFNYHGQILNANGEPVSSTLPIVFSIYADAEGTTTVYTEKQLVEIKDGLFNVLIGSVTPIPEDVFDQSDRFLGIAIDGTVQIGDLQPLTSTPYAFKSRGAVDNVNAGAGLNKDDFRGEVILAIAQGGVTEPTIRNRSVTAADLGEASVTHSKIIPGSVRDIEIEDNAVTSQAIADNAVGSDEIGETVATTGIWRWYNTASEAHVMFISRSPVINVRNNEDHTTMAILSDGIGSGQLYTISPDNNILVQIIGQTNTGSIRLQDDEGGIGDFDVRMYVANSTGIISADVKNFRMPHPTDQSQEIWYASIEGPEAAVYVRGTASLTGGNAFVAFPEHFRLVANTDEFTVRVTPLDANSTGLAVSSKSTNGFEVQELFQGSGAYAFDWEVKSTRKGFDDYRVIRSRFEHQLSN